MENDMSDVRERNMTLRGAAKKNSVPYSTLKDRIQGRVMHGTKPGVKTVLSPEEENDLVLCIQVFSRKLQCCCFERLYVGNSNNFH